MCVYGIVPKMTLSVDRIESRATVEFENEHCKISYLSVAQDAQVTFERAYEARTDFSAAGEDTGRQAGLSSCRGSGR